MEVKTGGTFEPGIPRALFHSVALRRLTNSGYGVTADGQRFLFVSQGEETPPRRCRLLSTGRRNGRGERARGAWEDLSD